MPRFAAAAFAGALLASCGGSDLPRAERVLAMGTWVDIVVQAPDEAAHARLIGEIERMLRVFERDYYAWSDGALARLNAGLARGEAVQVDAELARLLRAAQRYSAQSGGAFDPAVGELVELWGFHSGTAAVRAPPDPAAIEAWLGRRTGIRDLVVAPDGTVRFAHSRSAKLDLGAIAKGEAVDRIVRRLAAAGVESALVNAGGDLRVLGDRAGLPWRVGVKAPRAAGVLGVIELADGEAAFTSGDYERFYELDGRRMHHILDPATGYPVEHTQAVTVIAQDGQSADAAATALLVAGPGRWRGAAAALGIERVLRVDATGEIEMTPAMRERLQAGAGAGSDIIAAGSSRRR